MSLTTFVSGAYPAAHYAVFIVLWTGGDPSGTGRLFDKRLESNIPSTRAHVFPTHSSAVEKVKGLKKPWEQSRSSSVPWKSQESGRSGLVDTAGVSHGGPILDCFKPGLKRSSDVMAEPRAGLTMTSPRCSYAQKRFPWSSMQKPIGSL